MASTAVSPATQRRGESPRKVSLGVTVTTAPKPPGQIAPERLRVCTCSVSYSAERLWPWGAGTRTRGWAGLRLRAAAAVPGNAALAAGLRAGEDKLLPRGCGAG